MNRQTVAQKILSRITGYPVTPGEIHKVKPDSVLVNEILGMVILPKLKALGARQINREISQRIMTFFITEGLVPLLKYVNMHQNMRDFCREHNIKFFEVGTGICHLVFAEQGGVLPGYFMLGTDSHTLTSGAYNALASGLGASAILELIITGYTSYTVPETIRINLNGIPPKFVYSKDIILNILGKFKERLGIGRVLEYQGDAISRLSISARTTICNMAIEGGAVASIFPYDDILRSHLEQQFPNQQKWLGIKPDADACYVDEISLELSSLSPTVACPHYPNNIRPIDCINVEIDQVFIGSCTNGQYEDLKIVADILHGRKVKTLTLIVPGTHEIFRKCTDTGLTKIFLDCGCRVLYPSCHACFGGPNGLLAPGQRAASTSNRNYIGRMGGDATTEIYLMSPASAAATALYGRVTHPGKV